MKYGWVTAHRPEFFLKKYQPAVWVIIYPDIDWLSRVTPATGFVAGARRAKGTCLHPINHNPALLIYYFFETNFLIENLALINHALVAGILHVPSVLRTPKNESSGLPRQGNEAWLIFLIIYFFDHCFRHDLDSLTLTSISKRYRLWSG